MSRETQRVNHSRDAVSLRAACGREGCPVCLVVLEGMERAMDSWNYEGFSDIEARHALIRARGFCPLHTWQLAARHNTFQLALVYQEVLTDMLAHLEREAPPSHGASSEDSAEKRPSRGPWWKFWSRWRAKAPSLADLYAHCLFCNTRTKLERRVVETLVQLLLEQEMQGLLRQSTGLCRWHFRLAAHVAEHHGRAWRESLVACQRACLTRTAAELREQIRKHDHRFGHEPRGDEMTAWRRGAQLCAGNEGVY